ncbi:hypothetical protein [Bacteroides sp. 51]|uniref:hypothetical protein n=1 Tax=Bacteroides sp. 51 TaxID=2302938 RepID=UPI0013D1A435|nr:hypothetical protein [Bacteroides sp. 51]NDV84882.1 hypothetical protein [Bacteroides sp. 51]
MTTINQITTCRNVIKRAIEYFSHRLNFSTTTLEYDLNDRCTVFIDVECYGNPCRKMEVVAVELVKDGVCSDHSYPNIAAYMGRKLDAIVREMNDEEYERVRDWEYDEAVS